MKIAVLVGSLRVDSLNRKGANVLISLAPKTLEMEMLEIGDLPLYNDDLDDENAPAAWKRLRGKIRESDGVLFVTPEYNRSVPGVLKNAIDIASRPYGENAWAGKPAAVISFSPGAAGGFGANHHLRQSLVFLDMPAMQQPEAYIGHADDLFDSSGGMANQKTKDFLRKFIESYSQWATKIRGNKV